MKTSNFIKQLAVFGTVAAMTGFSAITVQAAPAAKTIRVLTTTGVDATMPDAAIWKKAPATQVNLQPAFPGHGSIVGIPATTQLVAQAVRTGDRIFIKLVWSDSTVNTEIKDTAQFVDGAAVQFPVNGKATTISFMGDAQNPVNVWHWRADGRTENLMARGFGTAMAVPFEGLRSASVRTDSGWAVVLTRPLRVKKNEGASLQNRKTVPIAFAAWDGANQERDGLKAVTLEWWQLQF
ncbi:MAG: chlorate reductase subunit gamma [Gammaproteobacteria bacterium]|nr:chlorate reductase subunit gamma [Rhodocyclaceae bacterium]MBU3908676.1 chlorate reductase subunit gamma [Gammaproteobacteria bacterium]MBU3990774.1 chlorate reductase subunit gamma [Gammaproteobacteria bacterium]MBU4004704.1 chlorate reductase subunit gamma [Gammaproteobacteria bacterium]MBU4021307.1 chlorate reductase subunit gamma [Gammaproteobacteria bacterium]